MSSTQESPDYVILGAGVVGLTTAWELKDRFPDASITIVAKFLPGDRTVEYCSPWAGANWCSMATDNGPQEARDEVSFHKFAEFAKSHPHCGIQAMPVRSIYDSSLEDAGVLSEGTGKVWYENLVGGLRHLKGDELQGAQTGFEFDTWMIDTGVYLGWLFQQVLAKGVKIRRTTINDIKDLLSSYPNAKAIFNCSGLGSYSLKGVEDKKMYPTRGQILLVENPPNVDFKTMYIRSPKRVFKDTTYVFPRYPHGGVILGGCRMDGNWDGVPDLEFADDIIRRCIKLVPGLGSFEEVKSRVLMHGVGLRPSREGGARVEKETINGRTILHNYGAAGAGYQASWGLAKDVINLIVNSSKL